MILPFQVLLIPHAVMLFETPSSLSDNLVTVHAVCFLPLSPTSDDALLLHHAPLSTDPRTITRTIPDSFLNLVRDDDPLTDDDWTLASSVPITSHFPKTVNSVDTIQHTFHHGQINTAAQASVTCF